MDKEALKKDLQLLARRHGLIGMAVGYAWAEAYSKELGPMRMGGISVTLVSDQVGCGRPDVAKAMGDAMELWLIDNRLKEAN